MGRYGRRQQRSASVTDADDLLTIDIASLSRRSVRNASTPIVPRYDDGRGDDCLEAEVATRAVLIEHKDAIAPESVAPTPTLPVWPGPHAPPALVAHLYAPYAPPPRVAPGTPTTMIAAARPSTMRLAQRLRARTKFLEMPSFPVAQRSS